MTGEKQAAAIEKQAAAIRMTTGFIKMTILFDSAYELKHISGGRYAYYTSN